MCKKARRCLNKLDAIFVREFRQNALPSIYYKLRNAAQQTVIPTKKNYCNLEALECNFSAAE